MLPSFIEKHCHLDKTLLGDRWRSVPSVNNIFERLESEKEVVPSLETTTKELADQQALQTFEGRLSYEIVAFPQHGLLQTKTKDLVKEALDRGADFVGGVDPATMDGDIEASLNSMVEPAVEGNAGIDLHLHDPYHLGIFTMKRLAQFTNEAGLQGQVAISHALGLGDISASQAEEMAELLAEAGITIISSVPIDRKFPPINLLREKGVAVAIGCDNIFDVWSPFGNGDVLARASRLAEISGWTDEQSLAQTLSFITNGKTPLNSKGTQVWPKPGDEASIVFVEASCSAEAVARRSSRVATIYKGNIVSGSLEDIRNN